MRRGKCVTECDAKCNPVNGTDLTNTIYRPAGPQCCSPGEQGHQEGPQDG